MNTSYQHFFGFREKPFASDINQNEIMETEELLSVKNRFNYAVGLGGIIVITGEIGSGKSTALRYASNLLHPSAYTPLDVTATSGSILELYRQITAAMGIYKSSNSKAVMVQVIRNEISQLVEEKKKTVVLIIDEASLLRLEVFSELHTICQFQKDSKPWLPMILAGQSNLVDNLSYRTSASLASRVVARSHLEGLDLKGMKSYLEHHLRICGVTTNLFDDSAVTAIHQGSGGLLRKSNHLARGSLIAAAKHESAIVTAEHVRLASTEIF